VQGAVNGDMIAKSIGNSSPGLLNCQGGSGPCLSAEPPGPRRIHEAPACFQMRPEHSSGPKRAKKSRVTDSVLRRRLTGLWITTDDQGRVTTQ
jgi:hypothetical protein